MKHRKLCTPVTQRASHETKCQTHKIRQAGHGSNKVCLPICRHDHTSQRTYDSHASSDTQRTQSSMKGHSQSSGSAVWLSSSFTWLYLVGMFSFCIFLLYNGTSVWPHSCPNVYLGPDHLLSNFTSSQMQDHFWSHSDVIEMLRWWDWGMQSW